MTRSTVVVLGLGLASALATARPVASAGEDERVEVRARPAERRVDVSIGGQPFTSYVWPERLAKPVLFPIRSAAGTLVTRGFPLQPRPGERADHPHQVGFWLTYGDVNGVDFWGNSEAIPPAERAKMGHIRQAAIDAAQGGADRGELAVRLEWVMPDGSVALQERTRFVFRGAADRRLIDRVTTLTAVGGRVAFGDTKEGMLGLRVARPLEGPSTEPEVFTDASGHATTVPVLDNAGVNGVYTGSEGRRGDAVWGTRNRWVALSGRVGSEDLVLVLMDHPQNPGFPTYWHARSYGLFAANPFGAKTFSNGKDRIDFGLDPGAPARFRHRLLILHGPFSAERAEAAWKEFVAEYGK
ncbi:MAG TPA: PmoA family protein [Vicinamibacteria bacterium]|nr:PmoA family protein [Vicinamibacteria bacterium]